MKHGFTNMIFTVLPIQSVTGKRAKRLSLRIENRVGGGGDACKEILSLSQKTKHKKLKLAKSMERGQKLSFKLKGKGDGVCMQRLSLKVEKKERKDGGKGAGTSSLPPMFLHHACNHKTEITSPLISCHKSINIPPFWLACTISMLVCFHWKTLNNFFCCQNNVLFVA